MNIFRITLFSFLCSIPAILLVWKLFTDQLGANPVEYLEHATGDWTIYFLFLTLAISPINNLFRLNWKRYILPIYLVRRILGLSAFSYALLHLLTYFVFDMSLSFEEAVVDIMDRPFILIGMLAFLIMTSLAITSTAGWQKRLKKNWFKLHKGIYILTFLGIVHYIMLVKADLFQPMVYLLIFAALMLYRRQKLPP